MTHYIHRFFLYKNMFKFYTFYLFLIIYKYYLNAKFNDFTFKLISRTTQKVEFFILPNSSDFKGYRIHLTENSDVFFNNFKLSICKWIGYNVEFAKINFTISNSETYSTLLTSINPCCKL